MINVRKQIYEEGYWIEKRGKMYRIQALDNPLFTFTSPSLEIVLEFIKWYKIDRNDTGYYIFDKL